ncbi:MAG: tetratricopeptide repeat protein [Acidobacteria bacterium]|nr:tetratricopeptide repeat protein [Acidobacteriota bacterium]
MNFSSWKTLPRNDYFSARWALRCACLMVFATLVAGVAQAQIGGIDSDPGDPGSGGKNTIKGNVYYPGGRRLDIRAKVKLRSLFGGEQFTLTDDNGAFSFRRQQSGTYTLIVDAGREYELATENVDIIEPARRRDSPGMVINLEITLQLKKTVLQPVGTVSALPSKIPEAAMNFYTQALEAVKSGDQKKALELLDSALKVFPQYVAALNEKGVQLMRQKDLNKAAEALNAAIKLAPEAFTPRLNYGMLLVQTKQYPKAVDELYKALKLNPASATGHLYIGRALVMLNSFDDAEKFLLLAVRYGNDKDEAIEAHRYLGAVYIEKKNVARAAQELEKYLALSPNAKDAKSIGDLIKQLRTSAKSN